jgi:DNA polymerase-3 subunit epsilon
MYAIIDTETSGTTTHRGRITEIAIINHDGQKIIDTYSTLINPESPIPREITRLTGITNEMVREAPKFYEVAKTIVERTSHCTLVAHNAQFDYNFLRREFELLGYNFQVPTLCTVKTSRLLMPGLRSYSLGNLCRHLNITNHAQHRAAGDAMATVALLEHLIGIDPKLGKGIDIKAQLSHYLHPALHPESLFELPEATGVYYLHDDENRTIYVGKSKNIRQRIYQHLRAPRSNKALRMQQQTARIDFQLTGSEIMALLLESEEIKRLQPVYNRAQKRALFQFGIFDQTDLFGYRTLRVSKITSEQVPLAAFTGRIEAEKMLQKIISESQLCAGLCGMERCGNGCLSHSLSLCRGAGVYAENPDSYNMRVTVAISRLSPLNGDFLILDKGRQSDEKSAICIRGGRMHSRGYIRTESQEHIADVLSGLPPMRDNLEVRSLLRLYLSQRKAQKIINLKEFAHAHST